MRVRWRIAHARGNVPYLPPRPRATPSTHRTPPHPCLWSSLEPCVTLPLLLPVPPHRKPHKVFLGKFPILPRNDAGSRPKMPRKRKWQSSTPKKKETRSSAPAAVKEA